MNALGSLTGGPDIHGLELRTVHAKRRGESVAAHILPGGAQGTVVSTYKSGLARGTMERYDIPKLT